MKTQKTQVVIVGAGLAGIYTALNLPETIEITLLSAYEANSDLAQGGVASKIDPSDSFEGHMKDTLKAGHFTNDKEAVDFLVKGGPEQIAALIQMGVDFDKNEKGEISATLEGGHSSKRILHVEGDQTGHGIMEALRQQLHNRPNINYLESCQLLSLIRDSEAVYGVIYMQNGELYQLYSSYTVLATGGLGDLFAQTTNHEGAIGTGIALAHQAGAECRDMQYIQFHPTAFYDPIEKHYFLISEAVRGEGAILLNQQKEAFMPKYDKRGDLAPRDIVSKAIYQETRQVNFPYVYLDTRHLDQYFLKDRFPTIYWHLFAKGYQIGQDLIPVTPVAHYTIGGIAVSQKGESSLKRLYACGEVTSTGVHGANRLASNSLLECLVYGRSIADTLATMDMRLPEIPPADDSFRHFVIDRPDTLIIDALQQDMTNHLGILRHSTDLKTLQQRLSHRVNDLSQAKYKKWSAFYEHTMLYNACMIIEAAIASPSLGCHTIDDTQAT